MMNAALYQGVLNTASFRGGAARRRFVILYPDRLQAWDTLDDMFKGRAPAFVMEMDGRTHLELLGRALEVSHGIYIAFLPQSGGEELAAAWHRQIERASRQRRS